MKTYFILLNSRCHTDELHEQFSEFSKENPDIDVIFINTASFYKETHPLFKFFGTGKLNEAKDWVHEYRKTAPNRELIFLTYTATKLLYDECKGFEEVKLFDNQNFTGEVVNNIDHAKIIYIENAVEIMVKPYSYLPMPPISIPLVEFEKEFSLFEHRVNRLFNLVNYKADFSGLFNFIKKDAGVEEN